MLGFNSISEASISEPDVLDISDIIVVTVISSGLDINSDLEITNRKPSVGFFTEPSRSKRTGFNVGFFSN